jgi:hypothetical protein
MSVVVADGKFCVVCYAIERDEETLFVPVSIGTFFFKDGVCLFVMHLDLDMAERFDFENVTNFCAILPALFLFGMKERCSTHAYHH